MTDTIAAIATPPGLGGIGIIRLSGPQAEDILLKVFQPMKKGLRNAPLPSHQLLFGHAVSEKGILDECMAVLMRAPRSYTREDVAELHCHGSYLVLQQVLSLCLSHGARLADPGEFTRRAFENGRIDLTQAEAVMELISASSEVSRRYAVEQLQGGVSSFIRQAAGELYSVEAAISAATDYPEEIDEAEISCGLADRIRSVRGRLANACDENAARLVREGLLVVLYGRPNVGKSSLLNALLGEDKAIVTAIPGTTRDQVTGTFYLDGFLIQLVDTAGIRETEDPVEAIGVNRSIAAMRRADLVLAVFDSSEVLTQEDRDCLSQSDGRWTLVLNKSDLAAKLRPEELRALAPQAPLLAVSATSPSSLAPLKDILRQRASLRDGTILSQPRQLAAARQAVNSLEHALRTLEAGHPLDVVTVDLDAACRALAEITGDQVDERILDEVFAQFCVGK